ncbi:MULTISPECIES: Imm50 family immunity protein [Streptomyces]|uniref:Imm50 family immunity protein n=1 Tax=Streptomyces TaxID=1883 RepID=UPI0003AAE170|nr:MULTISPECIES: Imm50 family immunity protein [Streptomyces]MBZ6108184.1 immunity 50 family protein [Streptomyces olivaceus]MBZ6122068.1 immunity 50 family protein [Streptomyces olivaceus]MBZ6142889.1 immunity 50 family protein [Streptomyces olivaceus]MBZ6156729.1 immunity 50 family protein [Streptomyces olivaceus]MBZ6184525.1 immunity 50 family protein [Streptomyces olivaceus]
MTVDRFLSNPEKISDLYGTVPEVHETRLRSVNLNWRGPTVTLRIDLPGFPRNAPQGWVDDGLDTVQCQLQFLAVQNLSLLKWEPPTTTHIEIEPMSVHRRIQIDALGPGVRLSFDSSESVLVGHLSAFRIRSDGSDIGPHSYVSKIDSRRHAALPRTDEKTFYERL